jgi:hypothetical protein
MRKIVLILVILTIFSFSIVYAQEIYSIDINKNNQEMNAAKNSEDKNELAKNVEHKEKELNIEEQKEEEQKEEEQKMEDSIKKEEVYSSSETKSVQASPSKQSVKKESSKKSSSTKTSVKADEQYQEENVVKENDNKETKNVDGSPVIDAGNANSGSFKAKYLSDKKLKIMVIKGGERYTYDLKGDNTYQSYPLQLGDGTYKVSIMENIGGKEYKYVLSKEVEVKTSNPNAKYLTSVQMINWSDSMAAIKKAKSLTSGLNDKQKVEKIYSFITNNIKYDSSITKLPSGYVPSINNTYSSKKGICYDFSSIFAGMLRSVGVPTKLIKGEATNVQGYHSWNEVYVNGSWKIVDTSYDSQLKAAGHSVSLYKSGKDYSRSKQY